MKFVKFTAVALFVALAMTSCLEEKVSFSDEELNTTTNMGLLSISNLAVDCRVVENTPDGSIDPAASTASTRATRAVDANTFDCSIINEKNEVVMSFKYADRPTEAVELETGDYIFKIQSGEVPGAAWESPIYGSTKPFKIVRNETTEISEIVCSLLQIQVSISYSQDLLERLGDKTLTTVKVLLSLALLLHLLEESLTVSLAHIAEVGSLTLSLLTLLTLSVHLLALLLLLLYIA